MSRYEPEKYILQILEIKFSALTYIVVSQTANVPPTTQHRQT